MADTPPGAGHGALLYINTTLAPLVFNAVAQLNSDVNTENFERDSTEAPVHNLGHMQYVPSPLSKHGTLEINVNWVPGSTSQEALKDNYFANTTFGLLLVGPPATGGTANPSTITFPTDPLSPNGEYLASGNLIAFQEMNPVGGPTRTANFTFQPSGPHWVNRVLKS